MDMDVFAKARELGIETDFIDGQGQGHRIAHEALDLLMAAMPRPEAGGLLNEPVVRRVGDISPIQLNSSSTLPVNWQITMGEAVVAEGEAHEHAVECVDGLAVENYRLRLCDANKSREEWPLIVAPQLAYQGHLARSWLLAVQLYGLRSPQNWGIGDFSDLKHLIELAARWGPAEWASIRCTHCSLNGQAIAVRMHRTVGCFSMRSISMSKPFRSCRHRS